MRAPRDGVVSKALIRPGGLVNASTTLLTTLYSVDPIHVNFTVGEQKLIELKQKLGNPSGKPTDNPAVFQLKLIDGSDYPQRGRLDFVDAAVDPKNGTLQIRIAVPNPDHALRPGQFVRVIVPARENANAVRVPQRAVTELLGTQSVFVIGPDNKASPREIVAKTRIGNDWLVDKGYTRVLVEMANERKGPAPPGRMQTRRRNRRPSGRPRRRRRHRNEPPRLRLHRFAART